MRYLLLVLMLAGCGTPVKVLPVVHDCPKTVDYSPAQQNQSADELLEMANHYPMVGQMITDYGRERKALAPCQDKPPKPAQPVATGGPLELVPWERNGN